MKKLFEEKTKLVIISIIIGLLLLLCVVITIIYYLDVKNVLYNSLMKTSLTFSEYTTKTIVFQYQNHYIAKNPEELENLRKYYSYILEKDQNLTRFLIINKDSEIFFDSEEILYGWYDYEQMGAREVYYENLEEHRLIVNLITKKGEEYIEIISPYTDSKDRHIYSVLYYFSTKNINSILFSNLIKIILLNFGLIIIISLIALILLKDLSLKVEHKK